MSICYNKDNMGITYIIFFIIAFLAAIVSSTVGFGAALITLSFSTFLFDYKFLVGVVTIYFLANNVFKLIFFGKYIRWKTAGLVLLGSLPFVILGSFLLVQVPAEILKRLLGLIVLFYVINYEFGVFKKYKPKKIQIPFVGALYGFFSGLVGVGDPIKAALLNQIGLVKQEFIATMTIIAFIQNLFKVSIYSSFHLVTLDNWPIVLGLIIASFSGIYLGRNIVKKISPKLFRKLILLMLTIIAIKLLILG